MVMTRQVPVARRALVAEKYVNQRTMAFTRTHASAMQAFIDSRPGATEAEYYADFRSRLSRARAQFERDMAAIDADPASSFREKARMKSDLREMFPAWSEREEQAFVSTYGDPRELDAGNLQRLVEDLREPVWPGALREGEQRDVPKHEWEMKFYDALVNPQDGSLPLDITRGARTLENVEDTPISTISEDPEVQANFAKYLKNVCPICKQHFGMLTKTHTDKCKRDHGLA